MMLPLLSIALAAGIANQEVSLSLGAQWRPTAADHAWGVELGATWRGSIGSQCPGGLRGAQDDCTNPALWPIVGATTTFAWRGGSHFGYEVGAVGGVAELQVSDAGFAPVNEGLLGVGYSGDSHGADGLGLSLDLTRALGYYRELEGGGRTTMGLLSLSARLGGEVRWAPGGWLPPITRVRIETITLEGWDY